MKRGEIWTAAAGGDYTGKPRPVVVIQDDRFDETKSITVCALTSNPVEAPLFRLRIEPDARNGLRMASRLIVDKITTVPRTKLRNRIGSLADEDILKLNRAILVFLGIAAPVSA
jgi:mRNA interferase MazF